MSERPKPVPRVEEHACCASKGPAASASQTKIAPEKPSAACKCTLKAAKSKAPAAPALAIIQIEVPFLDLPVSGTESSMPVGIQLAEPGLYANDSGPPGHTPAQLLHLRAPPA